MKMVYSADGVLLRVCLVFALHSRLYTIQHKARKEFNIELQQYGPV